MRNKRAAKARKASPVKDSQSGKLRKGKSRRQTPVNHRAEKTEAPSIMFYVAPVSHPEPEKKYRRIWP
jgi:hypothetical protein